MQHDRTRAAASRRTRGGLQGAALGRPSDTPGAGTVEQHRASPPSRLRWRRRLEGFLYSFPAWVLLLAVVGVPIVVVFYLSLTSSSLISVGPTRYVGLANYRYDVFSQTFVNALIVTVQLTLLSVIAQFPIGYALAEALHRRVRGYRVFQSVLIVPMLLTPVAVGLMWRLLFDPDLGTVKWLLSFIGSGQHNILGSSSLAIFALVFINAWINIPFVMVMMLAGLGSLPKEPLEAAQIDGASGWRSLAYIKLPLLAPVIVVALLIRVIADFKLFDIIYSVTQGGPGTSTVSVSYLAYERNFSFYLTGEAAATAVAIAVLVLPLYFAFARLVRSGI